MSRSLFLLCSLWCVWLGHPSVHAQEVASEAELETLILALPVTMPGYFDDPDLREAQEGLYRLQGWIRRGPALVITPEYDGATDQPAFLQQVLVRLKALLVAYQAGDAEQVAALYAESSRPAIAAKLADAGYRDRWLQVVGAAQSFEPVLLWKTSEGYHCVMHMRSRAADGSLTHSPYAVIFNSDLEFLVGSMTTPMHANLMRYLKDPKRPPLGLLANHSFFVDADRDQESGGRK